MPDEHVSILQSLGLAVLALATVVWAIGLISLLRGGRSAADPGRRGLGRGGHLNALPRQDGTAPQRESVQLTPAEKDAFAGLVRQLSDGRGR
jgi:hypothetical protein